MAAATIEDLFNFEAHFESAAETFLDAATGITTFGTLSEAELTTPRVEVQFQLEQSEEFVSRRGGGASPNTEEFTELNGAFNVRVITDNAVGQVVDHATYRAKVRGALLQSADNWDGTTLPFYNVKWLQPGECSYLTDEDFNVTEMAWLVKFGIKRDAWPS